MTDVQILDVTEANPVETDITVIINILKAFFVLLVIKFILPT